jgi:hypothetical protein
MDCQFANKVCEQTLWRDQFDELQSQFTLPLLLKALSTFVDHIHDDGDDEN